MAETVQNITIVSMSEQAAHGKIVSCLDPSKGYRASVAETPLETKLVFPDTEAPDKGSIAYHPIIGYVTYGSRWMFSTASFIEGLKMAEENPAIIGHILYVDSGGGEVFGCHEAFEAVRNLKKPCIALIDSIGASAAYWICCAADKVYATSLFTTVGSIGIMGIWYNDDKALEKWGITKVETYSKHSDLKNKKYRDADAGKPEEYIAETLDPLAEQFLSDVKSVRPIAEDSEALRGQDYFADRAPEKELIDGYSSLEASVAEIAGMSAASQIDINSLNI